MMFKFRVMNLTKSKFNIFSKVGATGTTYVKINGVTTVLSSLLEQHLDLPFGLTILEIWSGSGNPLDCYGFKLLPI